MMARELLCIFGNSNGLKDIVIRTKRAKAVERKISLSLSLSVPLSFFLPICPSPSIFIYFLSLLSFLSVVSQRSKEEVLLKCISRKPKLI
jgi:hypothetical protein